MHAKLVVIRDGAPQLVPARDELQLAVDDLARPDVREVEDVRRAHAANVEVVRVLAPVYELDDHAAGPHLGAREAVAELLRDHLDARGWARRLRCEDHATSFGREKDEALGITAAASTPNHCSNSDA